MVNLLLYGKDNFDVRNMNVHGLIVLLPRLLVNKA